MGSRPRAASTSAVSHDAQTNSDMTPPPTAPQYARKRNSNRLSGGRVGAGGDGYYRGRDDDYNGDAYWSSRDYGPRDRERRRNSTRKKKTNSMPPEKASRPRPLPNKETLVLSVFKSPTRGWATEDLTFDPRHTTDRELWQDIRSVYRDELERWWRRWFLFKKLRYIVPIEYSANDVPMRPDLKSYPDLHSFIHAYHHANTLKTDHVWVDWFVKFKKDPNKTYGLEFKEQLNAQKLAAIAFAVTVAIIVVCIVWCIKGGELQTVFTVMSFVLGGATDLAIFAAELALVALYYQVQGFSP